jgi:UDP-GlcNAc:undecaprenyl-phosphate GlcNAc-1-phosphate transferase
MALLGLVDDRRNLPCWFKLAAQILLVLLLAYLDIRVKLPVPDLLNYAITMVWVLGIINAVNFLDNMDGLCAGVCAVASAFIVLIAAFNDQVLVSALGAALFGSCIGFLRYNFKPATIFMGDAGSLFLGFVLAVLGLLLRFPDNVNFVTWMVPVFILGLPIFDTTLVVLSRVRRGVNPFSTAGQDHTSHRLVMLGFSEREAVLILYLVSGMFGMIGMFITRADILEGYIIATTMAGLALATIHRLEAMYRSESGRAH